MLFLITLAAAFVLYAPTLTNAFEFDDINVLYQSIVRAPDVLSVITQFDGQTTGGSWRPLLHVIMWLEWHLFGTYALAYHAINVVFHAAAAFVLGAIAYRLTSRRTAGLVAGSIFLVQPFPEAVGWIVAGPLNVLSAVFYLSAILFHVLWRQRSDPQFGVMSFVFVALSLSCYEVALTYGAAAVAYDVLFKWPNWTPRMRMVRTGTVALVALAVNATFIVSRALILGTIVGSYGASTVFGFETFWTRFQTIARAFWMPANGAVPESSAVSEFTLLFQLALVMSFASAWAVRRQPRPIAFGLALAIFAFLPFVGFMSVTADLASSRYLYLVTAGLSLAVGAVLGQGRPRFRLATAALLVVSSAAILTANAQPWAIAGRMVERTVRAALRGPIQTFGMPVHDIYGAYTFGTASNIPEYPGANGIDVVTDGPLVPGREALYWDGVGELLPLEKTPLARWSGPDLRTWSWSATVVTAAQGDGLSVKSADGDPFAWSPALKLRDARANVVVVGLDLSEGTCARAQLIWRYAAAGDKLVYATLQPGLHEYVLVQTLPVGDDTLLALRFDPLLCPGTVRIVSFEVGGRARP